ncbi:MAG: hypothetical protein ACRCYO_11030 [Bacteroidia bacterium]
MQKIPTAPGKLQFYSLNDCVYCPFAQICKVSKADAIKLYQCQLSSWDHFATEISTRNANYKKQINIILSRFDSLAQLTSLPAEKFKDVTPPKERVKEYEIKTPDLRVYLFHLEKVGRVVVWAGIKGTQESDFVKFRNLKRAYLATQK